MKKTAAILLFLFSSTSLLAQKENAKIESAVIGFFNGLSLYNSDTLTYYTTSDFHLLEDGAVWNMDTLINKVMPRKASNVQRFNKFEFIKTVQNNNMAWVSYHNTAEFKRGDQQRKVTWLESAVLVNDKGRWKIQMLHSTSIKQP